jgi:protein-tyrosine phosphatase
MSDTVQLQDHDTRRHIRLEAVHNFRDLGGYLTGGGMQTRWGLLYRADGIGRLSSADFDAIRRLRLRTVIDLRSHAELVERGRCPHDELDVDYEHLPILDVLWPDTGVAHFGDDREFLLWAYREMLHVGSERFASAIRRLVKPGALPAVFHCTAGKDRTGLLAALVLSAVGVSRADVLADYHLTAPAMERMIAWAQQASPEIAERLAATPAFYFAAVPDALDHVLTDLCTAHGSIADYLRSIGVDDATLETLAALLLEPVG